MSYLFISTSPRACAGAGESSRLVPLRFMPAVGKSNTLHFDTEVMVLENDAFALQAFG
jgi:hypothetical protein